LRYYKSV